VDATVVKIANSNFKDDSHSKYSVMLAIMSFARDHFTRLSIYIIGESNLHKLHTTIWHVIQVSTSPVVSNTSLNHFTHQYQST
jgi:hypothetical protein